MSERIPPQSTNSQGTERTITGIRAPHKTIVIRPEDKIDTDKLQKDTPRVFAKMEALEKQNMETFRVSDETRRTRFNT